MHVPLYLKAFQPIPSTHFAAQLVSYGAEAGSDMHSYCSQEFTEPLTRLEERASSSIRAPSHGTTRQRVVPFAHIKVYFVVCRCFTALASQHQNFICIKLTIRHYDGHEFS